MCCGVVVSPASCGRTVVEEVGKMRLLSIKEHPNGLKILIASKLSGQQVNVTHKTGECVSVYLCSVDLFMYVCYVMFSVRFYVCMFCSLYLCTYVCYVMFSLRFYVCMYVMLCLPVYVCISVLLCFLYVW